ncbi:hypothetical protein KI387_039353, partial [Taxus chinensis]
RQMCGCIYAQSISTIDFVGIAINGSQSSGEESPYPKETLQFCGNAKRNGKKTCSRSENARNQFSLEREGSLSSAK